MKHLVLLLSLELLFLALYFFKLHYKEGHKLYEPIGAGLISWLAFEGIYFIAFYLIN